MIIAGDMDTGESYLCLPMKLADGKFDNASNMIVQVLQVRDYPFQHAILWPDVASEVAPIREGTICRLTYFRDATDEDIVKYENYAQSLTGSLVERMGNARSVDERAILARHAMGVVKDRRKLTEYKPNEV